MRVSSGLYLNPAGLVDKHLSPMWDQIKQINTHLPQVAHVSYYLETLFNLERNLELLAAQNIDHHILKNIQIFQGAGAYEVAVNEGFAGTVENWLASLIGPQGDPGVIDEPALSAILSDIANNAAGIAALVPVVVDHTAQFSNYVLKSSYNTHVNTVTTTLATHAAAIAALEAVPPFELPVVEVETLALGVFNRQINSALSGLFAGLVDVEDLVAALQINVDDNLSSFNTFVLSNATDITRITVLESSSSGHASSIVALESVTNNMAAVQLTLTAESATHFSSYDSLVIVTDNAALQINALQVTNNANAAAIETMALAYVTADEAVASLVTTVQADFEREIRQILPWHFNSEGYFWTTAFGGLPSAVAAPTHFTYVDVSGIGKVAQVSVFPKYLTPRGVIKPYIGMKLRLEAKVRATVNPTTGAISVSLGSVNGLSSAWAHGNPSFTASNVTGYNASDTSLVVADGWVTIARYVTCTAISTYDANWRPRLDLTHTGTGGTVQVAYFNIENVTHAEVFTSALVANESSARTTAIDAVATDVTTLTSSVGTLSSSVGTLSATVSTQASTIADIDGRLVARYAIEVDGNGNGAFVSLEDSTDAPSAITLTADQINLNGNVMINGTVLTQALANNAVSNVSAVYGANSLSITSTGGPLLINAALTARVESHRSMSGVHVYIHRGATLIYGPVMFILGFGGAFGAFATTLVDQPSAGTYTYIITTAATGFSVTDFVTNNQAISITELKK